MRRCLERNHARMRKNRTFFYAVLEITVCIIEIDFKETLLYNSSNYRLELAVVS